MQHVAGTWSTSGTTGRYPLGRPLKSQRGTRGWSGGRGSLPASYLSIERGRVEILGLRVPPGTSPPPSLSRTWQTCRLLASRVSLRGFSGLGRGISSVVLLWTGKRSGHLSSHRSVLGRNGRRQLQQPLLAQGFRANWFAIFPNGAEQNVSCPFRFRRTPVHLGRWVSSLHASFFLGPYPDTELWFRRGPGPYFQAQLRSCEWYVISSVPPLNDPPTARSATPLVRVATSWTPGAAPHVFRRQASRGGG